MSKTELIEFIAANAGLEGSVILDKVKNLFTEEVEGHNILNIVLDSNDVIQLLIPIDIEIVCIILAQVKRINDFTYHTLMVGVRPSYCDIHWLLGTSTEFRLIFLPV